MITAAHCVDPNESLSLTNRSKQNSLKITAHPNYGGRGIGLFDVAVVMFPPATSNHWVAVSRERARPGDEVLMIGYGCMNLEREGSRIKREGTNRISSIENGSLILRRYRPLSHDSGRDVTLCPGDSGGPMLRKEKLIGVASWWSRNTGTRSGHADLTHPLNLEFLQSVIEQHDIKIAGLNYDLLLDDFIDGTPRESYVFLAITDTDDESFVLYAAASKEVAAIGVCLVAQQGVNCTRENALQVVETYHELESRRIFKINEDLDLLRPYIIVALDADESIVFTRSFTIDESSDEVISYELRQPAELGY